jgi:NADH:ubiquinone oxidoreductase subunit E
METTHPSGDPRFADLDRTIESYNHESTALIQVLHAAQQMFGHLGADVLRTSPAR